MLKKLRYMLRIWPAKEVWNLSPGQKVLVDIGEEWVEVDNADTVIFLREWVHVTSAQTVIRFHTSVVCSIALGTMEADESPPSLLQ